MKCIHVFVKCQNRLSGIPRIIFPKYFRYFLIQKFDLKK
eukprot:11881.XXX_137292_137419_1 [CDS] Oithona nana genome sequencing.